MRISPLPVIAIVLLVPLFLLGQSADIILLNGKVLTVDAKFSIAEALAVRGDRILAVGSNADVQRFEDSATLKIDLKGKTVIPGLIDTHSHFHAYGRTHYAEELGSSNLGEYPIDWSLVKNKNDVLTQITQIMKEQKFKPGEWIFFTAKNFFRNPNAPVHVLYEELSMKDLDRVTPNNPVVMSIGGGTIIFDGFCLVNGKTWDILMNKYGDFIRKYGRLWRDSSGNPTGGLEPPASKILEHELLPRPKPETLAPMLRKELEEWNAMGLTTVTTRMGSDDVEALRMLEAKDQLKTRIAYGVEDFFAVEDPDAIFKRMGNLVGTGSSKLWIVSFTTIIVDGSGPRAATDQKRLNEFGPEGKYWPIGASLLDTEYRGASGNYYKDWFFALARNGIRLANLHVAGDRSVRRMLDIMEEINAEVPLNGKRWAFDHCEMVNPSDVDRAVKLGVYWSCAPTFINSSPELEHVYGEKVVNTMVVPVKTMLNKGAKVVFEMDRHSYIWSDLEVFLTRNVKGKVYAAHERIDKVTALKMITSWASEYVLREKQIGSLEAGKKADIAVLDRDYLTIPDEEVSEIQALMTICDGEIVHLHPQFAQEYQLKPENVVVATYRDLASR